MAGIASSYMRLIQPQRVRRRAHPLPPRTALVLDLVPKIPDPPTSRPPAAVHVPSHGADLPACVARAPSHLLPDALADALHVRPCRLGPVVHGLARRLARAAEAPRDAVHPAACDICSVLDGLAVGVDKVAGCVTGVAYAVAHRALDGWDEAFVWHCGGLVEEEYLEGEGGLCACLVLWRKVRIREKY